MTLDAKVLEAAYTRYRDYAKGSLGEHTPGRSRRAFEAGVAKFLGGADLVSLANYEKMRWLLIRNTARFG